MTDQNDHTDRIAAKLESLTSDFVESPPSVYTSTGTEGEKGQGETFTTPGVTPVGGVNGSQPKRGKARCTGIKKDGSPCRAYALGDAYGDASHLCAGHAGLGGRKASGGAIEHTGEDAKGLEQASGGASRKRNPLDALRELAEADPDELASLYWRAAKEGRDVRALNGIFDRLYADATHVDEPHTFDELAKLTRDERRQLISQLEAAGKASPFRADAWRAQQRNES